MSYHDDDELKEEDEAFEDEFGADADLDLGDEAFDPAFGEEEESEFN